jgi:hypothetical protein
VIVARFLFRPLLAALPELLAPGGLLVYETFTTRQRELGWGPTNPAFLLEEGELAAAFAALEVVAREEGLRESQRREWVASLAALKPDGAPSGARARARRDRPA